MKLVKTSAIAVAISALLAGPVLAQGASSGTQTRGGAQGKTQMQGGASGGIDEDTNAPAGAASQRAGAKTGMKGTVGAGSGAPKVTGGAAIPPATSRSVPSAPFVPSMLVAGSLMSRTARAPCKPRGVVIVQGFRGHFANAWPRTDRICGEWNLGTCDRKSGSPVRRERDRFCSAVKQPATTTAYFPRPTVCARRW